MIMVPQVSEAMEVLDVIVTAINIGTAVDFLGEPVVQSAFHENTNLNISKSAAHVCLSKSPRR